jgi:hypothetical protein
MSYITDLLDKPPSLSTASKYTAMNGVFYLGTGPLLVAWSEVTQTIFMDAAFVGHEAALMRVIGLTLGVIGWLYLFGGRSGARQIVATSVADRAISSVLPRTSPPSRDRCRRDRRSRYRHT